MSRVEKDILVTGDICCVDPSPELYHVHNEVEIKHKWTEPVWVLLVQQNISAYLSDNVQVFSHKLEAVHQGTGPSLFHKSSQELLT